MVNPKIMNYISDKNRFGMGRSNTNQFEMLERKRDSRKCTTIQLGSVHIIRIYSQQINVINMIYNPADVLTLSSSFMISAAESESTANHCPLCHCNIPPYEDGWRHHLIGLPCPNHPRKKHLKNRK